MRHAAPAAPANLCRRAGNRVRRCYSGRRRRRMHVPVWVPRAPSNRARGTPSPRRAHWHAAGYPRGNAPAAVWGAASARAAVRCGTRRPLGTSYPAGNAQRTPAAAHPSATGGSSAAPPVPGRADPAVEQPEIIIPDEQKCTRMRGGDASEENASGNPNPFIPFRSCPEAPATVVAPIGVIHQSASIWYRRMQ